MGYQCYTGRYCYCGAWCYDDHLQHDACVCVSFAIKVRQQNKKYDKELTASEYKASSLDGGHTALRCTCPCGDCYGDTYRKRSVGNTGNMLYRIFGRGICGIGSIR